MNFENLLIPMEPAEEAVSSDKSLDKIIGRLKLLSVNYQSLQLRMNGTDSAIKNQLIVYNTQLVQILNDLQKLPKNATESFGDIAEEPATEGLGNQLFGGINPQKLKSSLTSKLSKFSSGVRVVTGEEYGDPDAFIVVGVHTSQFNDEQLSEINKIISNNHPVNRLVKKRMNKDTLEYHFR